MRNVYNSTGHDLIIPNVVKSDGIYLYDAGGKRYMDLESGVWCISIGHNHERVNRAIAQQSGTLMQAGFCYSNEIVDSAAASILSLTGFEGGKCVFLCSGSEAIEISRQIAKHTHRKNDFDDPSRLLPGSIQLRQRSEKRLVLL